jgi:hypothetical protein
MNRKQFASMAGGGVVASALAVPFLWSVPSADATIVTVYKTPTCGCCKLWVDHLLANGFDVDVKDLPDLRAIKAQNGVSPGLASCHTALVDGYVFEGHVPADLVAEVLRDRPDILGLSVPGMVVGSPGMEMPGQPAQPYEVLAFDAQGRVSVYASR